MPAKFHRSHDDSWESLQDPAKSFNVSFVPAFLTTDEKMREERRGDCLWWTPPPQSPGGSPGQIGPSWAACSVSSRLSRSLLVQDITVVGPVQSMVEVNAQIHCLSPGCSCVRWSQSPGLTCDSTHTSPQSHEIVHTNIKVNQQSQRNTNVTGSSLGAYRSMSFDRETNNYFLV